MDTIKTTVFNALKTIDGVQVTQEYQNVFAEFPAITFRIASNRVNRDLDGNIVSQTAEVAVDLWHESSVGNDDLLVEVEQKMRSLNYELIFQTDVPNPDEQTYHTSTRFRIENL